MGAATVSSGKPGGGGFDEKAIIGISNIKYDVNFFIELINVSLLLLN